MADPTERIDQFKKMAESDPTNELGHFSLGKALLDAGDADQAAVAFKRVIDLNPNISKAYQLRAQALLKLNRSADAIAELTAGVKKSDERGDLLPRNEMSAKLKELGAPVPEYKAKPAAPVAIGEGQVLCKRCGLAKPKLGRPPFRTPFGQKVYENTCADCWKEAIALGTKVINELRLPLADPQAQKVWDQHIAEFLQLDS
jgi:Fe-S cluster biosynthesis and repair protein YggX